MAAEKIRHQISDVITLDVEMPLMDGIKIGGVDNVYPLEKIAEAILRKCVV